MEINPEGEKDVTSSEDQIAKEIDVLLTSQGLAVLSTQRNGQPYSSLMAYAHADEIQTVLVATGKSTRKNANLVEEARVSLLVDNRSNSTEDFHAALALTILGRANPVEERKKQYYENIYLERHPYLEKFLESPSTILYRIEVYHYLLVKRFQNVMEYHLRDEMDMFT